MNASRIHQRKKNAWAVFLLLLGLSVSTAVAQSVTLVPNAVRYAGIGTNNRGYNSDFGPAGTIELNAPSALAFDGSGNLIVADRSNNCVRRIDTTAQHLATTIAGLAVAGNGDTCNTATNVAPTPAQGLLSPASVASDALNDVYIADTGHNCVRLLPAGATGVARLTTVAGACGASPQASSTPTPTSLAADAAGNLYILVRDTADSIYQVLRHDAGSANGTLCRVAGSASAQNIAQCSDVTAPPALLQASGIALDGAGALYIADTGNNCVRKFANGAFSTALGTCGSSTSVVSGPSDLAFSLSGSMYVSLTDNNQILRYTQTTGELIVLAGNPNTTPGAYAAAQDGAASSSLPLNGPIGLATDASNNLYVADSGNSIVRELRDSTLFPETNVGQASAQQVITLQINTASTLTLTPGPDYSIVPGNDTCTGPHTPSAAGTPPSFCTVGLVFTPTAPGNRYSPLTITDTSTTPNTIVSAGLQGVGEGPLAQLFPGQANTLASSLGTVLDVTHDSTSNVYALIQPAAGQPEIVRFPAGGGASAVVVPQGVGMKTPTAIGIDAAGNWYVADTTGSTSSGPSIQRYGADGSVNLDYITGIVAPSALQVDGFGNLLIAEQGTANDILRVYAGGARKVVAGGGTAIPTEGIAATTVKLTTPSGVALGPNGTIYFSDAGAHYVFSVDASGTFHVIAGTGGSSTSTPDTALGQALLSPTDLDVDAAGDLFIVDSTANKVYTLFAASNVSNNLQRLLGDTAGTAGNTGDSGLSSSATINHPQAVTITPAGIVYVADSGNASIRSVSFPNETLDFGSVAVGSVTTMGQSLWNNGNALLIRTGDPVVSNPNFAYDTADTTCGAAILSGVLCDIDFTFQPTATGTQTGTATFADTAPNSPHVVTLTGTVAPAVITAFTADVETETYGGPYVGTVTITTNGGTIPQGTVTFTVNGTVTCSITGSFRGSATCTLPAGTLLPVRATPYPVTVTFTGNYPDQSTVTTLTEQPRILTETVNSKTKAYLQPNPALDGTPNALLNGVGSDSFTVTYGFGATPITTTTAPGTYTGDIVATITPNGSTNPANYTINVTPGDFTITRATLTGFGADPQTEVYGGAYTATAGYAATAGAAPIGTITFRTGATTLCSVDISAAASCSLSAGTHLHAGTYPVTVTYTGDSNYAGATATTTLTVTPAPLTVTVADQTKAFGAPVPNLTGSATVTGLVNGDTVGSTIILTYSTTVTASTPIGTYPNSITVAVSGSAASSYTITNTPGSFTVGGVTTSTTLQSSATTVTAGVPVTFTAKVSAASAVPNGTVVFSSDGTLLGAVTLDATGTATLTTSALTAGTHTIRAAYSGNADFASSFATTTVTGTAPVGSFTLSSTPDSQYIRGSGSMTYSVTVISQGGFAGTVSLACTGLPADASCNLNPSSVTLTSGSTATVTVTTTTTAADASVAANHPSAIRGGWPGALAISAAAVFPMQLSGLGMLAMGFRRRRKLRRPHPMLLLLLSIGLLGLAGCGCPSTTFHIYPVTVTGTSVAGGPAAATTTMYLAVATQ